MTARRFVDKNEWEKWIDIGDILPDVYLIFEEVPPPLGWENNEALLKGAPASRMRVFRRQQWVVDGTTREHVYVEDGAMLPNADRFGPNMPSLHRERAVAERYTRLVLRLREISDGRARSTNALGAAILASHAIEEVEAELRLHENVGRQ